MSAVPHRVGVADEFGDDRTDVAPVDGDGGFASTPVFDASAGDDWGSVLAVACLLVALILGVLLLGGG